MILCSQLGSLHFPPLSFHFSAYMTAYFDPASSSLEPVLAEFILSLH